MQPVSFADIMASADFNTAGDVATEDETDEDSKLNKLREYLRERGFVVTDGMDSETLKQMKRRAKAVENPNECVSVTATLINNYEILHNKLKSVDATQPTRNYYNYASMGSQLAAQMNHGVENAPLLTKIIIQELGANPGIDAEGVFQKVANTAAFSLHGWNNDVVGVRRHINTMVEKQNKINEARGLALAKEQQYRKFMTNRFTADLYDTAQELLKALKDNKVFSIKQVFRNEDGLYTVCPSCGERIQLTDGMMEIVAFHSEKSDNVVLLPVPVKCKCENYGVVSVADFNSMQDAARDIVKQVKGTVNSFKVLCSGANVISIRVGEKLLDTVFGDSIVTTDNNDTDRSEQLVEESLPNGSNDEYAEIDVCEFNRAATEFYRKLKLFSTDTPTLDSLNEMVVNNDSNEVFMTEQRVAIALMALIGRNYTAEHNKALFSLINALSEYEMISEALDTSNSSEYEKCLKFIKSIDNRYSKVDGAKVSEIISMYSFMKERYYPESKLSNVTFEEAVAGLTEMESKIRDEIVRIQERRATTLQFMSQNAVMFGYCPVTQVSNMHLGDLNNWMSDDFSFEVFNRIADIMLITNYGGEYFDGFMGFVSTSAIKTRIAKMLTVIGDTREAADTVGRFKEKKLDLLRDTLCFWDFPSRFSEATKVAEAVRTKDLVKFLKHEPALNYLREELLLFGVKSNNGEGMAEETNFERGIKTSSISSNPIVTAYYQRVSFTEDDVRSAEELVKGLRAKQFILLPKEGETFAEYVNRFRTMDADNSLTDSNSLSASEVIDSNYNKVLLAIAQAIVAGNNLPVFSVYQFMAEVLLSMVGKNQPITKIEQWLGCTPASLNYQAELDNPCTAKQWNGAENISVYQVLTGFYFTSISDDMEKIRSKYESVTIPCSVSLATKEKYFSFRTEIADMMSKEVKTASDEIANDDREEAREELVRYAGTIDTRYEVAESATALITEFLSNLA